MPVKNEKLLLEHSLFNLSKIADHIIIADQMSTDGSREVYKRFKKVQVIDNYNQGHSNIVRWQLLKEARKIPGNNLIVCVDADEFFPIELFKNYFKKILDFKHGTCFAFKWIQLWKSLNYYNDSGVWKNNWKRIAFIDDRKTNYSKKIVINDHTERIPNFPKSNLIKVEKIPLIHLQWVSWKKTQIKQAWYRCSELIRKKPAAEINYLYSVALDNPRTKLKAISKEWFREIALPTNLESVSVDWHLNEILSWFKKYGITYFEPLQIWNIKELRDRFIKEKNRQPKPMPINSLSIKIVILKNKLKALFNLLKLV